MKELFLLPAVSPLLAFIFLGASSSIDYQNPLWERLLEKWGIAFVMFMIFWLHAKRTTKREDRETVKRELKEQKDIEERIALLTQIADLTQQQLDAQKTHITTQSKQFNDLKTLQKETRNAITNAESAYRMLTRKFKRPCAFSDEELKCLPEDDSQQEFKQF